MKAFICHSSADKLFVEELARELLNLEIDIWLDKWEIKVGDSLIKKISEGLSESDYLIIVLSKQSILSEWVSKELNYALMEEIGKKQVKVLPVLLEDCDIPIFLKEKLYANFRNDFQVGFQVLSDVYLSSDKGNIIKIEGLDFLTTKKKNSLCMEIIINNSTTKVIWFSKISLFNKLQIYGNGYCPFLFKAEYQILLPCFIQIDKKKYTTTGLIFEGNENEFAKEVQGQLEYSDASYGRVWETTITIPVYFKVPTKR